MSKRHQSLFLSTSLSVLTLAVAGVARAADAPSVEVYGAIQLDYVQDFQRVDPAWDDTLRPSKIPTTEGQYGSDGQAVLSVRQSKLGVRASIPVDGSANPIKTRFEFDLFGVGVDEGQTTVRPQHIYGSWGPWLAGQTDTLFMDIDVFPNTIDYWGPAGMVFVRLPQIRWTPVQSDSSSFAVALEKPGNDVDTGVIGKLDPAFPGTIQGDEKVPDLTVQWRTTGDWGHVQVAGLLRRVGYETLYDTNNQPAPTNDPSGAVTGWGVDVTANFKFGDDTLRLGVVNGEGIASYMNDGGVDLAPETAAGTGAKAVPLLGITAFYDHAWNAKWSSAIGYSSNTVDNTDGQNDDAFKRGEYAALNLLHTPVDGVMVGAELLWGQRTDKNGASGDDTRLQTSIRYTF